MAQGDHQEVTAVKKVACVGLLVADVMAAPVAAVPEKGQLMQVSSITVHNGGNAMTAALNLNTLGVPSCMVGKVGDDLFGRFLREKLEESGVDTAGLKIDPAHQTSASVVLSSPDGERSFLHCVGANGTFGIEDIDWSIIEKTDLVFVTGSFLMDRFDGAETADFLKKCQKMGKTTFLDVCWDAKGQWGKVLDQCLPYLDYFMPSIDEARLIAKCEEPEAIADVFMQKGAKNVVIKLGSKGSYLRLAGWEQGKVFPSLRGVTAVDTTGAGDSFCSGFLAAFARGEEPERCMEIANTTGAMCVTQKGATTGIKGYAETIQFMEEHQC